VSDREKSARLLESIAWSFPNFFASLCLLSCYASYQVTIHSRWPVTEKKQ